MAQDSKFTHITVGDDLDDDEVIVVGTPEGQAAVPASQAGVASMQPKAAEQPAPEPKSDPAPEPAPEPEPKPKRASRSGDYHETTLEDLDSSSTPLTQKIVIVVAIILIIVAILYFALPR